MRQAGREAWLNSKGHRLLSQLQSTWIFTYPPHIRHETNVISNAKHSTAPPRSASDHPTNYPPPHP